jgi:hypothetical protein
MSLQSLNFPPFLNTSEADIIADFFVPALGASVRYDRGVGYFVSTEWMRMTVAGRAEVPR